MNSKTTADEPITTTKTHPDTQRQGNRSKVAGRNHSSMGAKTGTHETSRP